jgi:hypothetical protein
VGARVDPAAGLVSLGDQSWPFDLDLESGTATVELGGTRLRLRPLRWREKVTLARFAHLGEEFLERQLVRACLVGGAAPEPGPAAEAAAALARWVNDPGGAEATLPLRTDVLSEVTLDVCRALGVRPADLDARTAAEVEELWRVATSPAAVPRSSPGMPPLDEQFNRIVIIPDTPEATTDQPVAPPAPAPPRGAEEASGPAPRATIHRDPVADQLQATGHGPATPQGPAGGEPAASRRRPAIMTGSGAGGGTEARHDRPAVGRFQVLADPGPRELPLLATSAAEPVALRPGREGAEPAAGPTVAAGPSTADGRPEPAGPSTSAAGGAAGTPVGAARPVEAVAPGGEASPRRLRTVREGLVVVEGAAAPTTRPTSWGEPAAWLAPGREPALARVPVPGVPVPGVQGGWPGQTAAPPLPAVAGQAAAGEAVVGEAEGRRLSERERTELFDELCERLERAAVEMGVDLEG